MDSVCLCALQNKWNNNMNGIVACFKWFETCLLFIWRTNRFECVAIYQNVAQGKRISFSFQRAFPGRSALLNIFWDYLLNQFIFSPLSFVHGLEIRENRNISILSKNRFKWEKNLQDRSSLLQTNGHFGVQEPPWDQSTLYRFSRRPTDEQFY